jgi:hypothetical protein
MRLIDDSFSPRREISVKETIAGAVVSPVFLGVPETSPPPQLPPIPLLPPSCNG